ncbi:hypothetical protein ACHAW5_010155 [Stephanodiscus triporus]|uniref:ShKT domain-containing protein n=1 Tax=Stephanodiscus triporus TaxID=2934178 RepID=A0ABD3NIP8_9STRA
MTNIVILMCLATLLFSASVASSSSSSSSSSSTGPNNREPRCIAVDSYSTYVCTDDPEASRRAAMMASSSPHSPPVAADDDYYDDVVIASPFDMDLGVEQRITGSDAEQLRIRNVLRRMRTYMEDEVLSRSEYEHVRDKCKNGHELCAFWTSMGECETNRAFMVEHCPAACRLCLLSNVNLMG